MHGHGNGGRPLRLPYPSSLQYTAQRLVLLELIVDPPTGGDRFEDLCETLGLADVDADAAVSALTAAGLAGRRTHVVFASITARYFEHLLPVTP
jgi:hypothetical protein